MRFSLLTIVFSCSLLLLGSSSAEEPRAILDRAIQAHGGATRLERTKKGHLKAKNEGDQSNTPFKYEIEEWFDLPIRYKQTIDGSINGTPYHAEKVVTEKEGWILEGSGPLRQIPIHEPFPVTRHWHAILASLLLLRDKDIQLKPLPNETKDGRSLVGFHANSPQVIGDFFFDKSTGLLAKTQQAAPNPVDGLEGKVAAFYDDYREIQGIHYPMRFKTTSGKTYSATITLSSIEFGGKIDESIFTKPQMQNTEPTSEIDEKTPTPRNRILIIATLSAGVVIGAVWFIVRASKRGKQVMPPR